MRRFRSGESAGHVGSVTKIPPTESREVSAVSDDLPRDFPRCSGSSAAGFHVCTLGLPPEFHGGRQALEGDARGAA
jgi:hypothetical protein